MRFAIRVEAWVCPLLAPFGVRPERAYVALDDDSISVRFGFWRHGFPRRHLIRVRNAGRIVRYGIGWHTNFLESLTVNGSWDGMVELTFDPPERVRLLRLPIRCKRLYVSLEDPDGFVRAVQPKTQ